MEHTAQEVTGSQLYRESPGPRRRFVTDRLSFESIFVAFVFFVVLSQFILYAGSETLSQPLRPLIVLILTVQVVRRGRLRLPVCSVALAMSVYQFLIWFFLYPNGGDLRQYLILIFYFMMLFSVAGFPWKRRELQVIIYAAFIATFVCAVVFFFSNNMTDFSQQTYYFMGAEINRNKNAYTFAFGVILGRLYLAYGRGRSKIIILLMTAFEGYCLIFSQCRGAFLGVFVVICMTAWNKARDMRRRNSPYLIFYIILFFLVCIVGYYLIKNSAVSRLVDSDNLSGRDDSIEHALLLFREAPLLGKIFGNGIEYEGMHTEGIGTHFVYLTYLLEAGIVGTSLIVLTFTQAARNLRGEVAWALFIFALSRTFFEGMDYYIFIPLILSICISNYERIFHSSGKELFCRIKGQQREKYFLLDGERKIV